MSDQKSSLLNWDEEEATTAVQTPREKENINENENADGVGATGLEQIWIERLTVQMTESFKIIEFACFANQTLELQRITIQGDNS